MFADIADQYAADVLDGTIDACQWVRLAAARFQALKTKYHFDRDKVERVVSWLQLMPHTKGIWALENKKLVLSPFQVFHIAHVFGLLRPDGTRVTRNSISVQPRKTGKTLYSAAVGNYMAWADGEHGAEVYCGASTEAQAWEVFRPAKQMVERTQALARRYEIQANAKFLTGATGSIFRPVIGSPPEGSSPSMAILDEAHQQANSVLRDAMVTGMGSRRQPLLWTISTAGSDISCPFYGDVLYGRQVLQGIIEDDERFFVEYTVDEGDDVFAEATLRKANPNYDVSVFADFLLARQREARTTPSLMSRYLSRHLDIWVQADTPYIDPSRWNALCDPALTIDDFAGQPCYAALDLATRSDLCAKSLLFRRMIDGVEHYYLFATAYLPEETINSGVNPQYDGWRRSGHIVETPGSTTDFGYIEQDLLADARKFDLLVCGFDPWQSSQLAGRMQEEGLTMMELRMSVSVLSEPMKTLESLVRQGRIHHNHPVLSYCIFNTTYKEDRNQNWFPRKSKPDAKIDLAVSSIMAVALAVEYGFSTAPDSYVIFA